MKRIITLLTIILSLASFQAFAIKDIEYVGIRDMSFKGLGLTETTMELLIEYNNPNKFGIDIRNTVLDVYINDVFVAKSTQLDPVRVPSQGHFFFPITVAFNPAKALGFTLGNMATAAFLNKPLKIKMTGTARVGKGFLTVKIPVKIEEEVNAKFF